MWIESLREMIKIGKRFHLQPEDQFGQTVIFDILNTEPVCCIYSKYHSYAPKVILDALEKFESENKIMEKTLKFVEKEEDEF